MKNILEMLLTERDKFNDLFIKHSRCKKIETAGTLVISTNKKIKYYHQFKDERGRFKRKYIRVKNLKFAYILAQKAYLKDTGKFLEKRIKNLNILINDYSKNSLDRLYTKLHPQRQSLIIPLEPTLYQKIENWKSYRKQESKREFDEFEIYTRRGERVRSKNEKILADIFDDFSLEYKYESSLQLNERVIYPDFTFFDPTREKEIYWEHFGMLDDPKYLHFAILKIDTYIKNSIFPGDRLLLTFETSKKNLDYQVVKRIVKKYLIF